jgi:hypothetical protein
LESRLEKKKFNSPTWAKAIVENGSEEWRADGQHTSRLLATCSDSLFPADLSATVDIYRLDDMLEVADLFDLFNNPASVRSNLDKLGVYIADYAELIQMDRVFLGYAAHGIDYYCRTLALAEPDRKVMIFGAREHGLYFHTDPVNRAFAAWLYGQHQTIHAWMISKPGIVAEIYADWRNHRALAERFWMEVFTESNPDPEDDTREFSRLLKDWSTKQPRIKQHKFRAQAKKVFDRYRRLANAKAKEEEVQAVA